MILDHKGWKEEVRDEMGETYVGRTDLLYWQVGSLELGVSPNNFTTLVKDLEIISINIRSYVP